MGEINNDSTTSVFQIRGCLKMETVSSHSVYKVVDETASNHDSFT